MQMVPVLVLRRVAAVLVLALAACASEEAPPSAEPVSCPVEPVIAEEGTSHFQFDSFSPDGRTLAVGWSRGEEARGTFLLDLEEGSRREVPGFNNGATFSPDGRTLVNSIYVENGKTDIAEYDLASGEITVVAPHEEWEWLASYSPSGEQILFNSYRTGNSDIYLYERSSGELRRLTDSPDYEAHAQLSPDGTQVVFNRRVGEGNYDIYRLDLVSGELTALTDAPGEEGYPSWTPDGRHIVYSSDQEGAPGNLDILVMTADGELVRRVTAHAAKDGYPFFAPDGSGDLYFNSHREPQGIYKTRLADDFSCR